MLVEGLFMLQYLHLICISFLKFVKEVLIDLLLKHSKQKSPSCFDIYFLHCLHENCYYAYEFLDLQLPYTHFYEDAIKVVFLQDGQTMCDAYLYPS